MLESSYLFLDMLMQKQINNKINYIYSRPRLRIKKPAFNNEKIPKLIKVIATILIGCIIAKNMIQAINPVINMQCVSQAKNLATIVINKHTANLMNNFKYEDLAQIVKDESGRIQLIKVNVNPVNEIASDVAACIQEDLNNDDSTRITIRLGSFFGVKLISGLGPKISIKMSTNGNVETSLKSEFSSTGINQTLHQIYLEIKCKIIIYAPYDTISEEVINQVLIAESIIVGDIPNSYYNVDNKEKTNILRNKE